MDTCGCRTWVSCVVVARRLLLSPVFPKQNSKSGPYCWVWEASSQFAIPTVTATTHVECATCLLCVLFVYSIKIISTYQYTIPTMEHVLLLGLKLTITVLVKHTSPFRAFLFTTSISIVYIFIFHLKN